MLYDLRTLRLRVLAILEVNRFKEKTIQNYNDTWDMLERFMASHGYDSYSREIGNAFLEERHSSREYSELTNYQKCQIKHIHVLNQMMEQESICLTKRKKIYCFDGEGLEAFGEFISYFTDKRSPVTIRDYIEYLKILYNFLVTKGKKIGDIKIYLMMQFLADLRSEKTARTCMNTISCLRVFFRYLCENQLLTDNNLDRWQKLLSQSPVIEKKIPSVYDKDEVGIIVNSIDRSTPRGKRDYAVSLLAARCAYRAQDIANLRISNLDWDGVHIKIRQSKNQRIDELTLSEEVGEALIDYLQYGRPDIESPYVFFTVKAPIRPIEAVTASTIVRDVIRKSGVKINGRKTGPHALRHSLATNLLKEGAPIPVITEILGHSSVESTMTYTRADLVQFRKCALEVPLVPSTFYEFFYGK